MKLLLKFIWNLLWIAIGALVIGFNYHPHKIIDFVGIILGVVISFWSAYDIEVMLSDKS